jgi:glycosyltransferase involved in cell wall biosynthesis
MTDEPLVSVVTPVYNGAEHLSECIESVLAQTYENWNCTIVDNASTDATPEIADRLAARDSRVRNLRFEEFVSATGNHNRAFAAAEGEFCKIVQADDWIYPECLSLMVAAARGHESVALISSYHLHDDRVELGGVAYDTDFVPGRDVLRGMLLGEFNVTGPPTATMVRTAFMRERGDAFYRGDFRHNDTEALFWLLSRHDFAFVHQVLTFSRGRSGSLHDRSQSLNSHVPEDIVFLLRYGRDVLEPDEYRTKLRERLRAYLVWHLRQAPRVSRMRDAEFFDLHSAKRAQILAEADGDPEITAAMGAVGVLLARRELSPRARRRAPAADLV